MTLIEALVSLWTFCVNGCNKESGDSIKDDNDTT
jgi:hypothetical protein